MESSAVHTQNFLSVLILAGGNSRRMGTDKALVPVDGEAMLAQVCRVARGCSDRVFVLTPWGDRYQAVLPPDCQVLSEARSPGEEAPGPLVGFAAGLRQLSREWVLLLACDLPRLEGAQMGAWAAQLPLVPAEAIAWLPRLGDRWDPLCGFYRRRCLASLEAFIEGGGRSFQRWLDREVVEVLPVDDPQWLFNCNTPDDLRILAGGDRPSPSV